VTADGSFGFPAFLGLEDGTSFEGRALGQIGTASGEICFNTSMTGYQEILTDPSYCGQIVAMTAPHIGNTGVNAFDDQSSRPWVSGLVIRDYPETCSSWRAEGTLATYLQHHGIVAIVGVDTRKLTRLIRELGAMRAAISSEVGAGAEAVEAARAAPSYSSRDLVAEVSTKVAYEWSHDQLEARRSSGFAAGAEISPVSRGLLSTASRRRRVAALDFGVKRNALDLLAGSGCDVTVLPASTGASTILAGGYDGVFLSNGPGDPQSLPRAISTVGELLGSLPVFGICLGHQILALAAQARTFKLKFGHRGGNHPVMRMSDRRIEITCQNHGYAVDGDSLASTEARLTHVNATDGTVEGLELAGRAFGVQYHPESGPGPHDSRYLFAGFHALMETFVPA